VHFAETNRRFSEQSFRRLQTKRAGPKNAIKRIVTEFVEAPGKGTRAGKARTVT
jgi:hypothetical protein